MRTLTGVMSLLMLWNRMTSPGEVLTVWFRKTKVVAEIFVGQMSCLVFRVDTLLVVDCEF